MKVFVKDNFLRPPVRKIFQKLGLARSIKYLLPTVISALGLEQSAAILYQLFGPEDLLKYLGTALSPLGISQISLNQLVVADLMTEVTGKEYGITNKDKENLVEKIKLACANIPTATSWQYHVYLCSSILRIPKSTKGDLVECGVYKGGSSASLSLVAKITGRTLWICDSFEGLPPDRPDTLHDYPHANVYGYYKAGMYAGPLEEVQENIKKYGDTSSCKFLKGWFSNSLSSLPPQIAFAFADVDLRSSLEDCIEFIWPRLVDGAYFFTDDSCDMAVVDLWFDKGWWNEKLDLPAPGYVGTGCGLPLSPTLCALGYTRKVSKPDQTYGKVSWLVYPDVKIN